MNKKTGDGLILAISNGQSKEDQLKSIEKGKLKDKIEKEFEHRRKEFAGVVSTANYGDLYIMHMEEYWGTERFLRNKNYTISEHVHEVGLHSEPWWKILYRKMVYEELEVRQKAA